MTQREEFENAFRGYNLERSKSDSEKYGDRVSQRMWKAYLEGLQAAKTQAVPQWISVSERLPTGKLGSQTEYLVYETLNNKVQHDYFMIPSDESSPFWNYYFDNVTHWMPLPAAPEQNK